MSSMRLCSKHAYVGFFPGGDFCELGHESWSHKTSVPALPVGENRILSRDNDEANIYLRKLV